MLTQERSNQDRSRQERSSQDASSKDRVSQDGFIQDRSGQHQSIQYGSLDKSGPVNPFRYGLSDQRIGMGRPKRPSPPLDIDQIMDFANSVFTGA